MYVREPRSFHIFNFAVLALVVAGVACGLIGLGRRSTATVGGPLPGARTQSTPGRPRPTAEPAGIFVGKPSTRLRTFRQRQGLFELQYPDNWSAYAPSRGYGVTIAPRGGLVPTAGGRQRLVCGLVVNRYVPLDGAVGTRDDAALDSLIGRTPLEEATTGLIRQVLDYNPHLSLVAGSERRRTISGAPSLSVLLSGPSPLTGIGERVTVITRPLPEQQVVYVLLVAPAKDYALLEPTSDRIWRSLRVNSRGPNP